MRRKIIPAVLEQLQKTESWVSTYRILAVTHAERNAVHRQLARFWMEGFLEHKAEPTKHGRGRMELWRLSDRGRKFARLWAGQKKAGDPRVLGRVNFWAELIRAFIERRARDSSLSIQVSIDHEGRITADYLCALPSHEESQRRLQTLTDQSLRKLGRAEEEKKRDADEKRG